MPKDYIKFIRKSPYREKLEHMIEDLANDTLDNYDLKKMSGSDNLWRIRIWSIRCIFEKIDGENYIIEINKRWDAYKS